MSMFKRLFKKPYLYTLKKPERFDSGIKLEGRLPKETISFGSGKGWWLMINVNGVLVVNELYAWDGCSPKVRLFGKVVGVPEGPEGFLNRPETWRGSLFHDVLCQFQSHPDMPFSREEIDLIFLKLLELDGFERAQLYYRAVRLFGGAYTKLTQLLGGAKS